MTFLLPPGIKGLTLCIISHSLWPLTEKCHVKADLTKCYQVHGNKNKRQMLSMRSGFGKLKKSPSSKSECERKFGANIFPQPPSLPIQ